MKKLTNTPHDHNFRLSLSNKEVAKDFLKTHLPTTIFKKINLRTLTICSNSYITPDLEGGIILIRKNDCCWYQQQSG